jgi:hypothetical protein
VFLAKLEVLPVSKDFVGTDYFRIAAVALPIPFSAVDQKGTFVEIVPV